MRQVDMQIGAERRPGNATFESIDPYTGEPWAIVPEASQADVNDAVAAARAAFEGDWGAMTGTPPGRLLRRLPALTPASPHHLPLAQTPANRHPLPQLP